MRRAIAVAAVLCVGCSLIPPPAPPTNYAVESAGAADCIGYDLASMAWTGVASASAGLVTAGVAILPAIDDYPDAVLGVTITDAILGAVAATAALLANESASRYTRCTQGGGP